MLLTSVNDEIQVVTGSAVTVDVHASWIDYSGTTATGGRTNTAITTATTTTVVDSPAASTIRNCRFLLIANKHATSSVLITVQHTDGTTVIELEKITLLAGEKLEYSWGSGFLIFDANGVLKNVSIVKLYNVSVAAQGPGFATDTYLTGSFLQFPGAPRVGTKYRLQFDVSKTAAGTATPIVTVRLGTAGTTADTARCTFTWTAGTGAADVGTFLINCIFRTVGSGTSAVLQGRGEIRHGTSATTGLVNLVAPTLQVTSGGFDSTVAGLGIGASVNGGTSAAWTVQLVDAELERF